jgi:hypothetical protein
MMAVVKAELAEIIRSGFGWPRRSSIGLMGLRYHNSSEPLPPIRPQVGDLLHPNGTPPTGGVSITTPG